MSYPVTLNVEPAMQFRNRATTALRLFLALPHLLLVGGIAIAVASSRDGRTTFGGDWGIIGIFVIFLTIVSWFSIVFAGHHSTGIRQFTRFYLQWRARAMAYVMLLTDAYPPFGEGRHTVSLEIEEPPLPRDRGSVALRLFLAIPHFIVLVFIMIAWCFTTVIAWFAILFTGAYPPGLYEFGLGAMRWRMRVDTYLLLMVDQYPPFSLE
jgi:hypothetical protein